MAQTENLIFYYLCHVDEETEPLVQSREYYICKQLKIPIFSLEYYADKQTETQIFLLDKQSEASRLSDEVHC
jgi:hypothetical protein